MEEVLGTASMRRVGTIGFPTSALMLENNTADGAILANLGRSGWFRVFFGRGTRIELPDGTKWRLTAIANGQFIEPMLVGDSGRVAMGNSRGNRSYGINGRDYAYVLFPVDRTALFKSRWVLREHDNLVATVGGSSIRTDRPIPVAAVLMCFALIKLGVAGEAKLGIPQFRWS